MWKCCMNRMISIVKGSDCVWKISLENVDNFDVTHM